MKKNIAVIGGGAAGMMAAKSGAQVTLYEKNEKLGKKIYITGKGRCNVTNDCSRDVFFDQVVTNPKFLYSAFETFDNQAVMQLLEQAGCPLKTERGGIRPFFGRDPRVGAPAAERGREGSSAQQREAGSGRGRASSRSGAFRWEKDTGRQRDCGDGRSVLSVYRFDRRWLSVGGSNRT